MNIKSQNRAVKDYDARKICPCGAKANHASGFCWPCYDRRSPHTRIQRKELYARLCDMGLGREESESRADWNSRCRQWCIEHSPLLRRFATSVENRKQENREKAILEHGIPE